MRNKTYNEIIRYLKEFADKHLDVMRFEEEDEDQMSSVTSMDEKFPMMFVTPTGSSFGYDMNDYSLRIYCYDRLTKDRKNSTNIRSKTNQILNDLDVWLRKESTLPFEITDVTDAQPFSSELMANVSGWYIDVLIDSPSFSVCEIPFSEKPILPLGVCEDSVLFEKDCSNATVNINDLTWSVSPGGGLTLVIEDKSGTTLPVNNNTPGVLVVEDVVDLKIEVVFSYGVLVVPGIVVDESMVGTITSTYADPNSSPYTIKVNGATQTVPFQLALGDTLEVVSSGMGSVTMIGTY